MATTSGKYLQSDYKMYPAKDVLYKVGAIQEYASRSSGGPQAAENGTAVVLMS